jgi:hypothetical protein
MITLLPANLDKSKGCIAEYYKKQYVRCIGWRTFVHKHGLKEGDLCLFELRKKEMRGKLVLTMLVHFEESELSDSSVRVGAAPHHGVQKEILSVSSGSDTESCSDISSRSARTLNRKQRGLSFLQCLILNFLIFYASSYTILSRILICKDQCIILLEFFVTIDMESKHI